MPGTSTSGVNRLRAWGAALVTGVIAVLAVPAVAWSATLPASGSVTVSAGQGEGTADPDAPTSVADLAASLPTAGEQAAVAPAATAGSAQGAASGLVAGQGVVSGDLSVDSVAAPPAALPWIVGVLVVLVIAGAARAYGRSPQRAALHERRAHH